MDPHPPHTYLHDHRHHASDQHHRQPPRHVSNNHRYSPPYPSPSQPPPFAEPYLQYSIPPLPSQPPNPHPPQFSFPSTPNHHPHCAAAPDLEYFTVPAPNRDNTNAAGYDGACSTLDLDHELRYYPHRMERGPAFVSPIRHGEELFHVGRVCYGGSDDSSGGRLYGSEISRDCDFGDKPVIRDSCELRGSSNVFGFAGGNLDYRESGFVGSFGDESGNNCFSRRVRGGYEKNYSAIPTKQVQKKSAFSRLQMPKYCNSPKKYDKERCYGSAYHDGNGSSSFRGKGMLVCSGVGVKDRRDGKAVDLDVSFKSNSLIAKAVVAPTSSKLDVQNDSPPKAKRLKSLVTSKKDSDSLPFMTKLEEDIRKPNRPLSMVIVPTGSGLLLDKDSPSKVDKSRTAMSSDKDSSNSPSKMKIEEAIEKLDRFPLMASTRLVKEKMQVGEGVVGPGSGEMGNCSVNKAALLAKSGPGNRKAEGGKSIKVPKAHKAGLDVQPKTRAVSIGKGIDAGPKKSFSVLRDRGAITESGKADVHSIKNNVSVTKCEAGNGMGEGMVLKADEADCNLHSPADAIRIGKGTNAGGKRIASGLGESVLAPESGKRNSYSDKGDVPEAKWGVINGKSVVGKSRNKSKADNTNGNLQSSTGVVLAKKVSYTGPRKSNSVVGERVFTPKSGKKFGCSNKHDGSVSKNEVQNGKAELGRPKKVLKADNASPDLQSTTDAVPIAKVTDGGPEENLPSGKDGKLVIHDQGNASSGTGPDTGKSTGFGDANIISCEAPCTKVEKKKTKKKFVKKVVKKVKHRQENYNLNPVKKNSEPLKVDDTVIGPAAVIEPKSGTTEGSSEVVTACNDINLSCGAGNDDSNVLCALTPIVKLKGTSQVIKEDTTSVADDKIDPTPKWRDKSVSTPQVGASCFEEIITSTSDAFEIPYAGLVSKSSENLLTSSTLSTSKTSIENSSLAPTDGGSVKLPLTVGFDGYPTGIDYSRIGSSFTPSPGKGLVSSQEPNLPCVGFCRNGDEECIAHPSMALTLPATPADRHDVSNSEGGCDPRSEKSSCELEENVNVPKKCGIFENEQQSSPPALPIELNSVGRTGISSSVLFPNKNSRECSVISQSIGNRMISEVDILSSTVDTLSSCHSHAKGTDNSQDFTFDDNQSHVLIVHHVGGFDTGLTSSMHYNDEPQGNGTKEDFVNAMASAYTEMDVDESVLSPGRKKVKLSCLEKHSSMNQNQEILSSLPNNNAFSPGKQSARGEDSIVNRMASGSLIKETLNMTGLITGQKCSASLFDGVQKHDPVFPTTGGTIDNSCQDKQLPSSVLLSEFSGVQNELSDTCNFEEGKEGFVTSNAADDCSMGIVKKSDGSEILDVHGVEKQEMGCCEMAESNSLAAVQFQTMEQNLPGSVLGNQSKQELPSVSTCVTYGTEVERPCFSNELMELTHHPISDRSFPEETSSYLSHKMPTCKAPLDQNLQKMIDKDADVQDEKPTVPGESIKVVDHLFAHDNDFCSRSGQEIEKDCPIIEERAVLCSDDFRNTEYSHKGGELHVGPGPCPLEQKVFPVCLSFVSGTSNINSSTSKSHTWHRTSNASAFITDKQPSANVLPMKRNFAGGTEKLLNASYVRKGHSLVRKPAAGASHFAISAVQKSSSSVVVDPKRNLEHLKTDDMILSISEGTVTSCERPLVPSVVSSGTSPNHTLVSSGNCTTSLSTDLPVNGCCNSTADPVNSGQSNHLGFSCENTVQKSPAQEDQVSGPQNSESQNDVNNGPSNRILYLKPKSNQLIATKGLSDPANIVEKTKVLTTNSYYKRKRNQLIRSSVGESATHKPSMPHVDASSEDHRAPEFSSRGRFNVKFLCRAETKLSKPSKFPVVSTSQGAERLKSNAGSLSSWKRYQIVGPQLFPWKRASYWRKFMKTTSSPLGRSCLASSQRLMLLRKRDAVYIRSKHGLSLRRSKVVSIGGASLKWSKSIERRSKQVNEEATRAVLEAEREKKEKNASISAKPKKENHSSRKNSGGRIFRIGSLRYKMDPSRRTLQRIPDDGSSQSASESKFMRKSYVPRRLVIGNEEYVRIGNGNQLIRDPKKRSRLLASEKVRWSLHTVRQRLAKKKKYCQFFTRFGKCNKDGGKCPYIHDPSKTAVCTKFLNGLCSNKDCKLTHKIIPERMQDCSFFLKGLCANRNCPYRHVNVNPNSPTCEAFLRGYCMDGNECRKKHSYVCPVFGATGNCPRGSKCKLHHPQVRNSGRRRKRPREKKNGQDRYFGNMSSRVLEPGAFVSERPLPFTHSETTDVADYITLGSSDEEAGECDGRVYGDGDASDLQCDDLDNLIKPMHIMDSDMTTT